MRVVDVLVCDRPDLGAAQAEVTQFHVAQRRQFVQSLAVCFVPGVTRAQIFGQGGETISEATISGADV